jgi:hypothetical protein
MYPCKVVSREINHSIQIQKRIRMNVFTNNDSYRKLIGGDLHILRNRLPENFSIWHQKGVDSTLYDESIDN